MIALRCLISQSPIQVNFSSFSQIKTCVCPIVSSSSVSTSKHLQKSSSLKVRRSSKFRDGIDESAYVDKNGAVEDMEGYLNQLSLEYDSVWDTKPSWCQPWTITLTGVGIITGSWLILNSAIVTSLVATVIFSWWYIFLYSFPKSYTEMIAERRKKVRSGSEDIYGMESE